MTFAILGGGQLDTGYTIDNSLRFNDNDSAFLSRTPGTAGNRKTYTLSTWVKRSLLTSQIQPILECFLNANQWTAITFGTNDKLRFYHVDSGTDYGYETDMVFRDVSAWYHIVIALDTTQATAANRMILYVNGNETTFDQNYGEFPQNDNTWINSTNGHTIGKYSDQTKYFDGYMAEYNFIDGQQLTASDFGEFDSDSGIWKPKEYTGSYGTNGFYLDFENSGSLGADQSGNGNNWTPNNLTATDQTTDTPTNNFATINALQKTSSSQLLSEGNLEHRTTGNWMYLPATFGASSGKWYAEIKLTDASNFNVGVMQLGGASDTTSLMNTNNTILGSNSAGDAWALYGSTIETGTYKNNNTPNFGNISTGFVGNWSNNDIVMIALDTDNQKIWFGRNGSWDNSGDPAAGTNPMPVNTSMIAGETYTFASGPEQATQQWNFGSPLFSITSGNTDENGYGNFEYAPPSGYLALCTQNLARELSPTIDDGSQYFNTLTWTGNGSNPRSFTGLGFQPDWTWQKIRSTAGSHMLYDSTRGVGERLHSDQNVAEATETAEGTITSFDSDGFTLDAGTSSDFYTNDSGATYVAWNWLANGGTTSSNTDGSITSTVQANPTAGFSIVTWTATNTTATIGHGLGKAPSMIIVKDRSQTGGWVVGHDGIGWTDRLLLNDNNTTAASSNSWQDTAPTSSVFYVGTNTNYQTGGHVAYCFANIEGYSKFGSYTANANTNGPFIYTGFKPAFIIAKNTTIAQQWVMIDNTRDTFNEVAKGLNPNNTNAEADSSANNGCDFLSNGFKIRAISTGDLNYGSGHNYIYMAFAENPFVSSAAVPVVAR